MAEVKNPLALALQQVADPRDGNAVLNALARNQAQQFNANPLSQAMNRDLTRNFNAVAEALAVPGRAVRGEYNDRTLYSDGSISPVSEALIGDAAKLAGLVSTGAMPMSVPVGSLASGAVFRSIADIEDLAKARGVSLSLSETPTRLGVNKIVVPQSQRGQGVGSEIMNAVAAYADSTGKPVTLTPSTDFGGRSVRTLENFYSRFGFGKNSGRSKDYSFSDSMVRYPTGR